MLRAASAAAVLIAAASSGVHAQPVARPDVDPPLLADSKPLVPAVRDPYANLFRAESEIEAERTPRRQVPALRAPGLLQRRATSGATVVCGLLVLPADPSIDPGIFVHPPADAPAPAMRLLTPSICRPEQAQPRR